MPMYTERKKKRFVLEITRVAYDAVLEHTFDYGLVDPLPVLLYDRDTGSYSIGAYSSVTVEENKKSNADGHKITYQVGRLIMCIESIDLVNQVDGKMLDYIDSKFVIR